MSSNTQPQRRSARLVIDCAQSVQRVEPDSKAIYAFTIENRSDEAQSQSLELRGLAPQWFSIDFDERRICFPGEQRTATIVVSVPEGAASTVHQFQVVAKAGPDESGVQCSLQVEEPRSAMEVQPRPPTLPHIPGISVSPANIVWTVDAKEPQHVTVTVRNVGSSDAVYFVEVNGLPSDWYTVPSSLIVPAGGVVATDALIHPPARADRRDYAFTIRVAAEGYADLAADGEATLTISERTAEDAQTDDRQPPTEQPLAAEAPMEPVLPPEVTLLPGTSFRFGPGEVAAQATLTIQNRSNLIERYDISVEGVPEEWYALSASDVSLTPGAAQQVQLRLSPRPGRDFPAGEYRFRMRVAPHSFPSSFAEAAGVITIIGVPAFDARLVPQQAQGRKEKFKLTLANTGTLPLSLWMEGSDPNGMCKFKFPAPPNLKPGDDALVPIWVGARRNGLIGHPETLDFLLRVMPSGGESTSVKRFDARLVHQPLLSPPFALLSLIAGLLAMIIGLVLALGPSRVSDGMTWLGCQRDSTFQEEVGRKELIKEGCGPLSVAEQCAIIKDACSVGPMPSEGTETPGTPTDSPTLAPTGIKKGDNVDVLIDSLSYRSSPEIQDTNGTPQNPRDDPNYVGMFKLGQSAIVVDGPTDASGCHWWKLEFDAQEGVWAAESCGEDGPYLKPK